MDKKRDGHKVRIILEGQSIRPEIICPHIGKVFSEEMKCAETVGDKVTGCSLDTSLDDIGWELFSNRDAIEIKQAPFEIEWWVEGSYDDAELWLSVIEDDNNTPYYRS